MVFACYFTYSITTFQIRNEIQFLDKYINPKVQTCLCNQPVYEFVSHDNRFVGSQMIIFIPVQNKINKYIHQPKHQKSLKLKTNKKTQPLFFLHKVIQA